MQRLLRDLLHGRITQTLDLCGFPQSRLQRLLCSMPRSGLGCC